MLHSGTQVLLSASPDNSVYTVQIIYQEIASKQSILGSLILLEQTGSKKKKNKGTLKLLEYSIVELPALLVTLPIASTHAESTSAKSWLQMSYFATNIFSKSEYSHV